jgi:hypothetical protein
MPETDANPFPGMNPYLEDHWLSVHARLVPYLADALERELPKGLHTNLQERVFVEAVDLRGRWFLPDVHVSQSQEKPSLSSTGSSVATVALREPKFIEVPKIQVTEHFIEIIDTKSGGRVITTIEVVSPSNKSAGPGRRKYLQKQREVKRSPASLVEIDLLRGGKPVTLARPEIIPLDDRTEYHVVVRRGWRSHGIEYYSCPLRDRLPAIKIPLRQGDADALIDLQPIINRVYENGGYADRIDYSQPPVPALQGESATWAAAWLKKAGVVS